MIFRTTMKFKAAQLFILSIILISGCKTSKTTFTNDFSEHQIVVSDVSKKYRDNVSFTLQNDSDNLVIVESTEHLFIEYYNNEYKQWESLPYSPCKCGVPCRPPSSIEIGPKKSKNISWNRNSTECKMGPNTKIPETITTYQEKGTYRMTFFYNEVVDEKRKNGKELVYYFKVI